MTLSKSAQTDLLRLAERWEAVVEGREGTRNCKEYVTDPVVGAAMELRATLANQQVVDDAEPLELLIFCPVCKMQHVDEGEYAVPHKRHACQGCGLLFSATKDVPNIGVRFFKGCKNPPT